MVATITRKRVAQALQIIANAGPGGFEYASAPNSAIEGYRYRHEGGGALLGNRAEFTPEEFRHILSHAAREKLVEADHNNTPRLAAGHLHTNTWTLHLTMKGYDFIEDHDKRVLARWRDNIVENIPTIIASVLVFVIGRLILSGIVE